MAYRAILRYSNFINTRNEIHRLTYLIQHKIDIIQVKPIYGRPELHLFAGTSIRVYM